MRNLLVAALIAAAVHAGGWFLARESAVAPSARDAIGSLSYTIGDPDELGHPATEKDLQQIDNDLKTIASVAGGVRLYQSGGVYASVPQIADKYGLPVVAGAWVDSRPEASEKEMAAAIDMVNRNPNVRSVVVGNETILRLELKPDQLIQYIRRMKRRVGKPVTTGETWDIWLKHPELVREVDYIAAHILPYWEGIPANEAVEYALGRYQALRSAYPGKRIVIAEFGWPSQGYNNLRAETGPVLQAELVRKFVAEAAERGIAFNIIEAFDQPWKVREGSVGAYWGIFDASRVAKFPLEGKVERALFYQRLAVALAIGALITIFGLIWARPTFLHALVFSIAANTLSAGVAMAALYPVENYLNVGSAIAWAIGMVLMVLLTGTTLVKVHEVAEVTMGRRPTRLVRKPVIVDGYTLPKVSVHIPAYRENPDMLKETLDSVARLDYPDFEVLVIVNNTPEERYWQPIEAHCRALGPRFKFVFLPQVAGFKAGALNAALAQMDPGVEVIALLDADYVVDPNWLKDLCPLFADPKTAMVQAPQDHRDGEESLFKNVMNSEYAGFFDIGMVQRNENDAAITHGTMLLIRRSAFEEVGGWSTDTITEDTELGLRLLEAGYHGHYTNRRYGWGMLPDTFEAFKTQRHRWAFGAMQIFRKHWRHMLPGSTTLRREQKIQFVTGWSYWWSDAFGVLAAYLNLLWVPMVLWVGVLIPMLPFTVPILVAFVVNVLHCVTLYGVRVRIPARNIVGAAFAAMSLQLTVSRAIFEGIIGKRLAFKRTDKGNKKASRADKPKFPARTETIIGGLLFLSAIIFYVTNYIDDPSFKLFIADDLKLQSITFTDNLEIKVYAATLIVQGIAFLSATVVALLEQRVKAPLAATKETSPAE
jgi:cellulose synthase/poly-beta-1,6-N-acetylglucosamine synthase-like glycosyltransferase/exo-beta-1,3-glucanase (GH17 family)